VKIALLDDYQDVALASADWSRLPPGSELQVFRSPLGDDAACAAALAPFDAIVAMRERTPFTAARLAALPQLRLLVTTGMRNAAIDLDACRQQGITVCGTGAFGAPTAELTWALILALCKRVVIEERALRAGAWQTGLGETLAGRRLGVVGLGKLGAQVARIGLAFGMEVLAWSPHLTPARAAEVGARAVDKGELFALADVVTLHLVLAESTRGIVGAAELGALKPTAWLVNTARAGLLDEDALYATLRAQRIAGAALDVHDREPLPADDRFRALDNCLLTPHLGYVTRENYAVYYRDALEDILAFGDGRPLRVL
jgi:phosphoglycerate dehydrogenase-like enzyme